MQQWQEIEDKIPRFETQKEKGRLAFKIKMVTIVVMLLSMCLFHFSLYKIYMKIVSLFIAEHLLSIISTAFYSITCTPKKTEPFEDYFRMELNQLFAYFEYSPYLAFLGKALNILSTFMWTYMDLFVMVVSIGLSTQFKKINKHLMKYKGKVSKTRVS